MIDASFAEISEMRTAAPSPLGFLGNAEERLKAIGRL
jgi:hypothetical protein